MKKLILVACLAATILSTACRTGNNTNTPSSSVPPSVSSSQVASNPEVSPSASESIIEESSGTNRQPFSAIQGLTRNEYSGIELKATAMENETINPGSVVPVTVTVKNTGDKTIVYELGESNAEIPEAFHLDFPSLQVVEPRERLGTPLNTNGAANGTANGTANSVSAANNTAGDVTNRETRTLKPGEEVTHTLNVMAIEPHAEFGNYARSMYGQNERYIGEANWADLQTEYPGLVAAKAGEYEGKVYLTYYVEQEGTQAGTRPTGYAEADIKFNVVE